MQKTLGQIPNSTGRQHDSECLPSWTQEAEAEDEKFKSILTYIDCSRLAWAIGLSPQKYNQDLSLIYLDLNLKILNMENLGYTLCSKCTRLQSSKGTLGILTNILDIPSQKSQTDAHVRLLRGGVHGNRTLTTIFSNENICELQKQILRFLTLQSTYNMGAQIGQRSQCIQSEGRKCPVHSSGPQKF